MTVGTGSCECREHNGNCGNGICGLHYCILTAGSCMWWAYCPDPGEGPPQNVMPQPGGGKAPRETVINGAHLGTDESLVRSILEEFRSSPAASALNAIGEGVEVFGVRGSAEDVTFISVAVRRGSSVVLTCGVYNGVWACIDNGSCSPDNDDVLK